MKFFKNEKSNKERGSATVEAIISFTGFLFAIFTILNVTNFCRAQMLISNAVDTATKEITQYSYFYKMSGLEDFSKQVADNAETGKTNLNDVIGTVGDLYSSVGTAVDNTVENATNIKNAVETGDMDINNIQNTLAGIKTDGTNIETSMNSVLSAFESVQDNPLLYMKSIIAVAGNESLDLLKSHVIAAPLAKMFTAKHFGSTTAEANETLKGMGVVDGLEGMNFKMSSIFSSDAPDSVHIVVYYKLRIVQLFGWTTLEVPMCKESIAQAWLGGDDVKVLVEPMVSTIDEEESETSASEESETDSDTSEEKAEEEKVEEKVNIEGSFWHKGEDGYGYENAGRDAAFANYFREENGIASISDIVSIEYGAVTKYKQTDSKGQYTGKIYSYNLVHDSSEFTDASAHVMLIGISQGLKGHPIEDSTKSYEHILYVPENISDDELAKIKDTIAKAEQIKMDLQIGSPDKFSDVPVSVTIVKAGGNYDYGSAK